MSEEIWFAMFYKFCSAFLCDFVCAVIVHICNHLLNTFQR